MDDLDFDDNNIFVFMIFIGGLPLGVLLVTFSNWFGWTNITIPIFLYIVAGICFLIDIVAFSLKLKADC